jgi:transcriptional regulator with XRE-family HTH domain
MRQPPYSPTHRRTHLAETLRQLRKDAGLTVVGVAERLGWSSSKLSRIESGQSKHPKPADVEALLAIYGAGGDQRQLLLALTRDTRAAGWWRGYRDVFRGVLPDLEAGASEIRVWECQYVYGLLQTEAYARAIFASEGYGPEAVERRVSARMARQSMLHRDHPATLRVLIDEAALRKRVGGPAVMRGQLLHLATAMSQPHISIRVVTDAVGAHPGMMGAFVLLAFSSPQESRMVYVESARTSVCMESAEDVSSYEDVFARVGAVALSEEDSAGFIAGAAERLASEGGEG